MKPLTPVSRACVGLVVIAVAVALTACESSSQATDKLFAARSLLEEIRDEHAVPSLTAAVARKGRVAFTGATGFADLSHRIPATSETVYNIGSISKVITAVAIMQLVEEGRITLDDSIHELLPGFPAKGRTITVRHILTHTGGICHYARGDFRDRR